ncbi:glycosyltransferase [Candidatus Methylopumilus universalis]|uniref:glycosyltransferase n=1 Tax=Candidatus Methylopumilus universalis TaxID=2588536 RepID=UPI003B973BDC
MKDQSFRNFEHIVIDSASTDGTKEIVSKYKDVIFISSKDRGIYFGMNKAFSIAKGEFIVFLNSDDWYYSSDVLKEVSLGLGEEVDALFGNIFIVNNYYPFRVFRKWINLRSHLHSNKILPLNIPHPSFFVRTSLIKEVGIFDTRFKIAADYDLISRTVEALKPSRFVYLNNFTTVMRDGGKSSKNIFAIFTSNSELLFSGKYSILSILKKISKKIYQIQFNSNQILPPSFSLLSQETSDLSVSVVYFDTPMEIFLKTIESLLNSKGLRLSIFIINNSKKVLPKEILGNKKIHVLNTHANIGFGSAHNIVILGSLNSRFHLCLNPDVSFEPNLLKSMISSFNWERIGFLIPAIKFYNGKHHFSFRPFPGLFDFFKSKFFKYSVKHSPGFYPVECVSGCFLLAQTRDFQKLGGFDERFFLYMEDVDISRRMHKLKNNYFSSQFSIVHRFERGSSKSIKLFLIHLNSFLKYLIKWKFNYDPI